MSHTDGCENTGNCLITRLVNNKSHHQLHQVLGSWCCLPTRLYIVTIIRILQCNFPVVTNRQIRVTCYHKFTVIVVVTVTVNSRYKYSRRVYYIVSTGASDRVKNVCNELLLPFFSAVRFAIQKCEVFHALTSKNYH